MNRIGRAGKFAKKLILPEEAKLAKFRQRLMKWFKTSGRSFPWRSSSSRNYVVIISEILLQRTQAARVGDFFEDFIRRYPSWKRLSRAPQKELRHFLQPLGLWRRRAATIVSLAREMDRRNGKLPQTRDEIEMLPGVGQYIANAILLFCFGERQPLLDVNMARVLERSFGDRRLSDIRYDPYLQTLSRRVLARGDAKQLNWAILDLASSVCLIRSPRCNACPVSLNCHFRSLLKKPAIVRRISPERTPSSLRSVK